VQQTARERIVMELYREGRIAAGKAAELLGIGFSPTRLSGRHPYFDLTTQGCNEETSQSRKI